MRVSPYGHMYSALFLFSALCAVGAVLTLVPWPQASWPNIMGYKSLCTFAPGATFGCALAAGITCVIRNRLIRKAPFPVFVPVVVLTLLLAGLVVSSRIWADAKAQYSNPDSLTAASVQDF